MTKLTTLPLTDKLAKRIATLKHVAGTASQEILHAAIAALPESSHMLEHLMPLLHHDERQTYRPS